MSGVEILPNHKSALMTYSLQPEQIAFFPPVYSGCQKGPRKYLPIPLVLAGNGFVRVPQVIYPYIRVLGYTCGLCSPDTG